MLLLHVKYMHESINTRMDRFDIYIWEDMWKLSKIWHANTDNNTHTPLFMLTMSL